jgi:hypothetical protein
VLPGSALAAVGLFLWAGSLTKLDLGDQWIWIVMAGVGMGMVLGPASTDALNRAPATTYGEATGILQTLRNFGASLGLALLGTVLILQNKSNIEASLGDAGVPKARADAIADSLSQSGGGDPSGGIAQSAGRGAQRIFEAVQHDFAESTQVVFYAMGGGMVACYIAAHLLMPRGKAEEAAIPEPPGAPEASAVSGA